MIAYFPQTGEIIEHSDFKRLYQSARLNCRIDSVYCVFYHNIEEARLDRKNFAYMNKQGKIYRR